MPSTLNSTLRYGDVSDAFAVTAVTAQSQAFGANTHEIRIVSTTNCWFRIGPSPTATAGDLSVYLPANVVEYLHVSPGQKIAAIRDTADGTFCMAEMTR